MISNRTQYGFSNFHVASALLLRSLLEQSLKLYLKTHNEQPGSARTFWDHLTQGRDQGYDPSLKKIVDYIDAKVNAGVTVFPDHNEAFIASLGQGTLHKSTLDQLTHRTNYF